MRLVALVASVTLVPLAQAALAQDTPPIREVHTLSVYKASGEAYVRALNQTQDGALRALPGATLVIESPDSLRVIALVGRDDLVEGTEGPNAVRLTPGVDARALRLRPVRDPGDPSGSTSHEVVVLVCTDPEGGDGCAGWVRATPRLSTDGQITLEIVDGATRGGGGVRTNDD